MKKIQPFLPAALLGFILLLIYLPALREFIYDWDHDENYSHGFLIPIISGYLVWRRRNEIKTIQISSSLFGLFILCFGLFTFLVGTAGAEWFLTRISLIFVLAGILLYLAGRELFNKVWFPVIFLIFMVPIPYVIYFSLTFPLQLFSTKMAYGMLKLIGFHVLRQGNIIHLPNYSLEVVEACSGMRSIISLSALGATIAYMSHKSTAKKIILFLSAFPIAIIANIFRLFITALGAVIIGPEFADGFLHKFSGIVVFLIALMLLLFEGVILSWFGKRKNIGPS